MHTQLLVQMHINNIVFEYQIRSTYTSIAIVIVIVNCVTLLTKKIDFFCYCCCKLQKFIVSNTIRNVPTMIAKHVKNWHKSNYNL